MDENDTLGIRITLMNSTDADRCRDMLAMPTDGSTAFPADMETFDIKPELLDLSDSRRCELKPDHQQVSKACQTEITLCDEFWEVRDLQYRGCDCNGLLLVSFHILTTIKSRL